MPDRECRSGGEMGGGGGVTVGTEPVPLEVNSTSFRGWNKDAASREGGWYRAGLHLNT